MAASDAVGRKLAALHVELGEGPCLEAARRGERVLVADLGAADAVERFPRFAAKALAGGVSAVYSFPLGNLDLQVGSVGCSAPPRPSSMSLTWSWPSCWPT